MPRGTTVRVEHPGTLNRTLSRACPGRLFLRLTDDLHGSRHFGRVPLSFQLLLTDRCAHRRERDGIEPPTPAFSAVLSRGIFRGFSDRHFAA
jgi:hypothetical protein